MTTRKLTTREQGFAALFFFIATIACAAMGAAGLDGFAGFMCGLYSATWASSKADGR